MQPPSPFPYSGGSRMEQALVPSLQGPNSNSMLGYVLGAQLQRQADQMGYDREMDQYNLTARDEAQRVQEQQLADRQAQRNNAILTSIINNPAGAAMVPPDYNLTDAQRQFGTRALTAQTDLRVAQAEAAGRRGTGTGTTRPDPVAMAVLRDVQTEARATQARLDNLVGARNRALASINVLPNARAGEVARINADYDKQQEALTARLAALRERAAQGLRPNTAQAPQAAPAAPAATPPAQTAQVDPGSQTPRTTAPAAPAQSSSNTPPPEGARGMLNGRMGTIVGGLFVADPQR